MHLICKIAYEKGYENMKTINKIIFQKRNKASVPIYGNSKLDGG
jgi:hypothetical protein